VASVADRVRILLGDIQNRLRSDATEFTESHTIRPSSYEEMRAFLEASGGFAVAPWCGSQTCEARVKEETKATIRLLPMDPATPAGPCIVCGERAVDEATWARAY
jgi:prolyl-tRNA synthetase